MGRAGRRTDGRRWLAALAWIDLAPLAVLLVVAAMLPGIERAELAGAAGDAQLRVDAPAEAMPGDRALVHVVATGLPAGAADVEVTLGFDRTAVAFGGATAAAGGETLGVVDTPHGVTVAGHVIGTGGDVVVGTFEVAFAEAGVVDLWARDAVVAWEDGSSVELGDQRVTTSVGGGGRRWPAPPRPDDTGPDRARPEPSGDPAVEVVEAVRSWYLARESGGASDVREIARARRADRHSEDGAETFTAAGTTHEIEHAHHGSLTFTVNSTGDGSDTNTSDRVCRTSTGTCTLRAAIQEANAHRGPDTIKFSITGTGPHTIAPTTRLPSLSDPYGGTLIDGYSQPLSARNTATAASNAVLRVQIVGTGPNGIDGLFVSSADNVVQGLALYNFKRAVWLYGTAALRNEVRGNFIGTNASGTFATTTTVAGSSCVVIQTGAKDNLIGRPGAEHRNVVSGCPHHGVALYDTGTSRNIVQNNIVGLTPSGGARLPNRSHGIDLNTGASDNRVGGLTAGERNVVGGNLQTAIEVSHGRGTQRNQVLGNFVGTSLDGTTAPSYARNDQFGIRLEGLASCSSTCGEDAGNSTVANNVVVASARGGIFVDKGHNRSTLRDNRVGLTANNSPAGNGLFGIRVEGGSFLITVGPGNTVAHNAAAIQVNPRPTNPPSSVDSPTNQNRVTRNSIRDNAGPGIDLAPLGHHNPTGASSYANSGMQAPVLNRPTTTAVTGRACAGCTVELFIANRPEGYYGYGVTFLTSVTATSTGTFSATLPSSARGRTITATATNTAGSTSEFAKNMQVP